MKDLNKLKAVLADGVEKYVLYKEAFELVKDAEGLNDYIKDLRSEILSVEEELKKSKVRGEKAKADTLSLEADYSEQAEAMQIALKAQADDHQKLVERMTDAANADVERAKKDLSELVKRCKDAEKMAVAAEDRLSVAEGELEKIRGQLKSI